MTVHSPLSLGLSEDELRQVGELVLNWAAVDTMLGYCLNFTLLPSGVPEPKGGILALDISDKVKLLSAVAKARKLPGPQAALVTELKAIYGIWGGDRNLVAHGIATRAVGGPAVIHSERKGEAILASDLGRFVARSNYALHVVMRLNTQLAGIQWDPLGSLPNRPA